MRQTKQKDTPEIRIGVSACLLGQRVRYDGDHRQHDYLLHTLADYFSFVAVCPEVELGLGTPREPIQLRQNHDAIHLVAVYSGNDYTREMQHFARQRIGQMPSHALHGYLFKQASPSCGFRQVKVHQQRGAPQANGVGFYAQAVMARWPNLPVEDEAGLNDSTQGAII